MPQQARSTPVSRWEGVLLFFVYPFLALFSRIEVFLLVLLSLATVSHSGDETHVLIYYGKWALLALFVVITFLSVKIIPDRAEQRVSTTFKVLAIFTAYILITSAISMDPAMSFFKTATFVLLIVMSFIILPEYVRLRDKREAVMESFFWFTAAVLFLNLVYTILYPTAAHAIFPDYRLKGFLGNPNTLGMFCFITMPVLIYRFVNGRRLMKMFSAGFILLSLLFAFLAFSRASLLAMAVIFAVYAFYYSRRLFMAGLVLFILAALVVLLSPILLDLMRLAEDPLSLRDQLWDIGYNAWKDHKILGTGYGTVEIITADKFIFYQKGFNDYLFGKHLHNIYLEALTETGILGAFIFLSLLAAMLSGAIRNVSRSARRDKLFFVGHLALLLAVIVHGMFESFLFSAGTAHSMIFWIISGISLQNRTKQDMT